MELNEFINTHINHKIDFDHAFGAQCVDVFRQYCKDVLEIEHTGAVNGAKDLWIKYSELPKEQMHFARYNSTFQMNSGDVVIWNHTPTNEYGHVAIFLGYINKDKILVFEQNGFKQDGCSIQVRNMDNCLGFLRFKKGVINA